MSKKQKLIERMRRRPSEMSFGDVCAVLEEFGYVYDHDTGSHAIFKKEGVPALPPVPKVSGRTVKRVFLIKIIEALGLDEGDE